MKSILGAPTPKQLKNEQALALYALCLFSLIGIVILARRFETCCKNNRSSESKGLRTCLCGGYLKLCRWLNQRTHWGWCGRPTIALITMVTVWLIYNAVIGSTMFAVYKMNHWASRFGWLCVATMVLCTALGLKNTPLVSLASASPAQLNTLHRTVGYTAFFFALLHATFYTLHFYREGKLSKLLEPENLQGMGAGLGMIVLFLAMFRHHGYEVFLASHIIGLVSVVILTGLHRPVWAKKMPYAMIFIAALWLADRIARTLRLTLNLINNSLTLTALPDGGTRMLLKKPRCGRTSAAGLCYYVWIPGISLLQMHPFTSVAHNQDGLEFVTKARGGFTGVLDNIATSHPTMSYWASVDGPYGHLPDVKRYNKLILIAGGSGAAFTFGLMNQAVENHGESLNMPIEFIWTVRSIDQMHWYLDHLHSLTCRGLNLNITIFVTRNKKAEAYNDRKDVFREPDLSEGNVMDNTPMLPKGPSSTYETIRKSDSVRDTLTGVNIQYRRMDSISIIEEAVMEAAMCDKRVLVAACGPRSLTDDIKDSIDHIGRYSSYIIDTHYEEFDG